MIGGTTRQAGGSDFQPTPTTRRRAWWCGIALLLGVFASSVNAADRPNILFIFADDFCFQNVHALGCDEIETPNIDRLVREGLTFSHAYNPGSWSGAVCVASRTMLNTGRFLWQAEAIYNTTEKERQAGRFWSEHLRQAGYDTYFTGKWHLKANAEKAFQHVTHVRPGMPNQTPQGYHRPIEGQPDQWRPWDTQFDGYWKGGKHWSEVLGDDAEGYLKQAAQRDEPFFMYLAFNAPHDPRQSPRAFVDKYPVTKIDLPPNFARSTRSRMVLVAAKACETNGWLRSRARPTPCA